jgi:hypothetical protein
MNETIRIRRCADSTLNGYVFSDRQHAHEWLRQPCVDRTKIELEEVEIGALMPCPRCGGSGYRLDVKLIRRLTAEEALNV